MKEPLKITIKSKYEKQKFGNWEVVDFYKQNAYKKSYANGINTQHNAYTYVLVNNKTKQLIKLSGNTIRLLNKGNRTIEQVLATPLKRKSIVSL